MRAIAIVLVTILGTAHWQPATAAGDANEGPDRMAHGTIVQAKDSLLPATCRRRIAVALLQQYRSDGDGPAEISQPRDVGLLRKTAQLIVRFRLDAAAAQGMLLTLQDPPPRRYRCIVVEADPGFLAENPVLSFSHPRIDPPGLCAEHETFEPFVELQRMAGEVQPCRRPGDTRCAIIEAAGPEANLTVSPR